MISRITTEHHQTSSCESSDNSDSAPEVYNKVVSPSADSNSNISSGFEEVYTSSMAKTSCCSEVVAVWPYLSSFIPVSRFLLHCTIINDATMQLNFGQQSLLYYFSTKTCPF